MKFKARFDALFAEVDAFCCTLVIWLRNFRPMSRQTRAMRILFFLMLMSLGVHAQVSNLRLINSALDEQAPVMTPDGRQLYFTITSNHQNAGGMRDHGDIWVSTLTDAGWAAPVHAGTVINNSLHNVVAGFSADGKRMYLMNHFAPDGNPVTTQGLAVSTMTSDGWSKPQNINIPYFKNRSAYQAGYISNDAQVLVFSADSYDTKGAEDIYASFAANGKWSEPINLGQIINTGSQDVCPSLSADKTRLYFASNGHGGLGSFDIFYSDRLDDTWKKWSAPKNLGKDVNSEGRELYYREAGGMAFLTSTSNSDGYADIRFHSRTEKDSTTVVPAVVLTPPKADTVRLQENVYPKADSVNATTRIVGQIINSKTQETIGGGVIEFLSADEHENVAVGNDGRYTANLRGMKEYHIKVESKGFIGRFEKLDLRTHVMKELVMNFSLQPIEIGTTVNLRSVLFVQSKPILLEESFDELDMVVDFMKLNPAVVIELSGHTDNRGRHEMNMKLSRDRVQVVKKYLVDKGVEDHRITGRGYGGTRPIADNEAEETRALNRRVEFTITKD
jgi:OOP family OmpA-OmpF porin